MKIFEKAAFGTSAILEGEDDLLERYLVKIGYVYVGDAEVVEDVVEEPVAPKKKAAKKKKK